MEEIRLGTIGSGVIVHSVLGNVLKTPGICLTAVYSRSQEKGDALAAEFGAKKVYTDMDAFLADENINFVYIATPNLLHYPQAKKALLAGKNVILEKPFCTTADHARELVTLAREKGLFLIDAVPTAFLPNLEVLKEALPKIGKVKLVQANYPGAADTSGIVVMNYEGFVSESTGAKDTWGVNFFQIEGETGYIYVAGGSNGLAEVRVVTKTSDETINRQSDPDRWFYEVQNLTALVLADDHSAIEARQDVMLNVMEVLETVRRNAGICFPGDR